MKYLFFDTETTGLPRNWYAPIEDVHNWPRLVQLAWILFDNDGNKLKEGNYIVKPENFEIPIESSDIHGITTERANKEGQPLRKTLEEFHSLIEESDALVAHNMSFDEKIIAVEFLRKGIHNPTTYKTMICTKELSTEYCAIPSVYGYSQYKWPKLSELHEKLFGTDFVEAHNAAVDVSITAKCFWEMKKRNIIL